MQYLEIMKLTLGFEKNSDLQDRSCYPGPGYYVVNFHLNGVQNEGYYLVEVPTDFNMPPTVLMAEDKAMLFSMLHDTMPNNMAVNAPGFGKPSTSAAPGTKPGPLSPGEWEPGQSQGLPDIIYAVMQSLTDIVETLAISNSEQQFHGEGLPAMMVRQAQETADFYHELCKHFHNLLRSRGAIGNDLYRTPRDRPESWPALGNPQKAQQCINCLPLR